MGLGRDGPWPRGEPASMPRSPDPRPSSPACGCRRPWCASPGWCAHPAIRGRSRQVRSGARRSAARPPAASPPTRTRRRRRRAGARPRRPAGGPPPGRPPGSPRPCRARGERSVVEVVQPGQVRLAVDHRRRHRSGPPDPTPVRTAPRPPRVAPPASRLYRAIAVSDERWKAAASAYSAAWEDDGMGPSVIRVGPGRGRRHRRSARRAPAGRPASAGSR